MIKKILFALAISLSLTACSSDDPIDNGGGSGTGGTGNGDQSTKPRNSIPASELEGKWVWEKNYYDVEVDDPLAKKQIIEELLETGDRSGYPRVGMLNFMPGRSFGVGSPLKYPEGAIRWNYKDSSDNLEAFGDYFTNNDTIYYYHWSLKRTYDYMVKKGDRITYHFDSTLNFKGDYPTFGVRKVIYYADYVRVKK